MWIISGKCCYVKLIFVYVLGISLKKNIVEIGLKYELFLKENVLEIIFLILSREK